MTDEERRERGRIASRASYRRHKDDPGRKEKTNAKNRAWAEQNRKLRSDYNKAYREANRETLAAKNKSWRAANSAVLLEKKRAYHHQNRDHARLKSKAWHEANPDRSRETKRQWVANNPGRRKADNARWRKDNPHYAQSRYATQLEFRIKCCLRTRLLKAIRTAGSAKSRSTMDLVGCDVRSMMQHIEAQFTAGMSWDNHGKWHIDHIRPICTFTLIDPAQQLAAFHYTNLRPLWAADNLARLRRPWREAA